MLAGVTAVYYENDSFTRYSSPTCRIPGAGVLCKRPPQPGDSNVIHPLENHSLRSDLTEIFAISQRIESWRLSRIAYALFVGKFQPWEQAARAVF